MWNNDDYLFTITKIAYAHTRNPSILITFLYFSYFHNKQTTKNQRQHHHCTLPKTGAADELCIGV